MKQDEKRRKEQAGNYKRKEKTTHDLERDRMIEIKNNVAGEKMKTGYCRNRTAVCTASCLSRGGGGGQAAECCVCVGCWFTDPFAGSG
jgi:hypothetical protein